MTTANVAASGAATTLEGASSARFGRLRLFNGLMAVLHLAQGMAILALSSGFKLPITTSFVSSPEGGPGAGDPQLEKLLDVPLAPLIASFLFISAVGHFALTLPGVNDWYNRNLERGVNWRAGGSTRSAPRS